MTAHTLVYGASPIRERRTRAEMDTIRHGIVEILSEDNPMTVRQVFYQAVSRGLISKTEQEYKGTIGRLLLEMRRDGTIPYNYIADNTRWMRKPQTWDSLEDALTATARIYRRSLWSGRERVECWLEKEALAGVLMQETAKWDVPLMVTRGYPSESYVYEAADAIVDAFLSEPFQSTHIYYFGDYDPSGMDISRSTATKLVRFTESLLQKRGEKAGWDCFYFERVAVTEDQIKELDLPTRPTKQSDSRARDFGGESVEVDAIPSRQLRELLRECIERHVDQDELKRTLTIEHAERETLQAMARSLKGAAA